MENTEHYNVDFLQEASSFCTRCGILLDLLEGDQEFCHRCQKIVHLRKRIILTGKIFGSTFLFVFVGILVLSFQGRRGIHGDWLWNSLHVGIITGLLASIIAVIRKGFRNNENG